MTLKQDISNLQNTMERDAENCRKDLRRLGEELDENRAKYDKAIDECNEEKDELKAKYKDKIEDQQKSFNLNCDDSYQRELEIRDKRIELLEVELDICNSGIGDDSNFDDLKSLFDREREAHDKIHNQN